MQTSYNVLNNNNNNNNNNNICVCVCVRESVHVCAVGILSKWTSAETYAGNCCSIHSGNACYHSVQNLLSPSLLSKSKKIKTYKTIILPVDLCGCDTWSLTLWEERSLGVFENRVLRRILGPKSREVTEEWGNSWLAANRLASQEGLFSMEYISKKASK
jgi:hypothetical protein